VGSSSRPSRDRWRHGFTLDLTGGESFGPGRGEQEVDPRVPVGRPETIAAPIAVQKDLGHGHPRFF
jgi:hypothetical protein